MAPDGGTVTPARKRKRPPSAPMEIATITDDIADKDIKCSCPGGRSRPPTGHTVFKCKDCDKWHHHNCMIGDKQIPPAALRTGYVCEPCKALARSLSAKKGVATKRKHGTQKQACSPTPEAGATAGRPTTNVTSSRGQTYSNEVSSDEDDGLTKMRFQLPLFTQRRDKNQSDNEDKSVGGMTNSGPRKTALVKLPHKTLAGNAKHVTVHDEKQRRATLAQDLLDEWKTKTKQHAMISCNCQTELDDNKAKYFTCSSCHRLQHKACALGDNDDMLHIPGVVCIDCRRKRYLQLKDAQAKAVQNAKQNLIQAERRQKLAELQRERAMKQVCSRYLWKYYCSLPNGQGSTAVLELTRMHYVNGEIVPINEPPVKWLDALFFAIHQLRNAAGSIIADVCGNDETALSLNNPDRLLRTLREIAVIVLHRGAYKGKRQMLGVLGEVLGLTEKGTAWKG